MEEVGVESLADDEQQLCVKRRFVEDTLYCTGGNADLLGEPLISVALAAQFVAD